MSLSIGLLLMVIFKAIAAWQNLVLREPMDQCVMYGNNATFHCNTRSYEAYWEIDGVRFQHPAHYNFTNYILETSSDESYTNITLTVITSEDNQTINITCYYFDSNHHRTIARSARLLKVSCFDDCTTGLPDKLIVTGAQFYFNSLNETITKLQFEFPDNCSNRQIVYNVIISFQLLNEVVASKGPINYTGNTSVVEELTDTLMINHIYFIQVEAYEYAGYLTTLTLSNKWKIGTYLNLEDFCDDSCSITTPGNSSLTTTKSDEWVPIAAAGGILGVLITIGIAVLSIFIRIFIQRIKKPKLDYDAGDNCKGRHESIVMEHNPIYANVSAHQPPAHSKT